MGICFKPVTEFGEFTSPLRNIRAYLNETELTLDLVPSRVEDQPWEPDPTEPEYRKIILGNARPIVEADKFLRLDFGQVWGWLVHEEFSDNLAFKLPDDLWPRDPENKVSYPICKVIDSPWRAVVPEYQGGDSEGLFHFRIVGMTTYMDVMGWMPEGRWIANE